MRALWLAAIFTLAGCGSAVDSALPGNSGRTGTSDRGDASLPAEAVILPGDQIKALLGQCSRGTPEAGEASWQPGAGDIVALEEALPAALAASPGRRSGDWSRFPQGWRRQYVGIVRGGRRFVYGNFYPASVDEYASDSGRWRREPVVVCDGGSVFFGAEYDVEARSFTQLDFNGFA